MMNAKQTGFSTLFQTDCKELLMLLYNESCTLLNHLQIILYIN
ncbi:hypothetical protein SD77_4027 [Bacillus badius]|uniref:Mobile element protein n=1 Tax=Bacillus badius TaxID=1455 RepID=A0ABR5AUD3_BACBA|nr:hypothetical protein SD77_4027 [Bacillus badius]